MTGPAARRGWAGRIRDEWLLGLFAGLALVLAVADPQPPAAHSRWLQPSTLCALAGLLITIEGIRDSGLVQRAAAGMIARLHSSRAVGLFLVTLAAVLSTVLTNDVSLFLVVPLTVVIGGVSDLPVGRLVVFEALAVNAGSTLSPIGSPQNLLIWQRSGLSFPAFVLFMAPVAAIMFAMTAAVTWFGVPRGPVAPRVEQRGEPAVSRVLAVASTAGLALMTVAIELGVAPLGAAVVAAAFALGARRTLGCVDWCSVRSRTSSRCAWRDVPVECGCFMRYPFRSCWLARRSSTSFCTVGHERRTAAIPAGEAGSPFSSCEIVTSISEMERRESPVLRSAHSAAPLTRGAARISAAVDAFSGSDGPRRFVQESSCSRSEGARRPPDRRSSGRPTGTRRTQRECRCRAGAGGR